MKLIGVRLINFRCFQDSGRISIRDLTAFVGANDIGKSSVLEALDIFFNEKKANVPISIDDLNVVARTLPTADVEIRCFFSDSDSSASTEMDGELPLSLKEEELVNENGELEMGKRYRFKEGKLLSLTPEKCFRVARRQVVVTKEGAKGPGLLSLSDKDLCEVCRENGLKVRKEMSAAELRAAIRRAKLVRNERRSSAPFELDLKQDVVSSIARRIESFLPLFYLFRADRENNDSEDEVQTPIKAVVSNCLEQNNQIRNLLKQAADLVTKSLSVRLEQIHEAIGDFDPAAVSSLKPSIPAPNELRWSDVFKSVSLKSGDKIAINRRGSGIKRLVLLGFFRSEADRPDRATRDVIYAIEEPETSQHFDHQRQLADALRRLSGKERAQVLLTTHSPVVVSRLDLDDILAIRRTDNGLTFAPLEKARLRIEGPKTNAGDSGVSMNEVNYLVFGECRSEYHDELFGFIDERYGTGKNHVSPVLRASCPAGCKKVWHRKFHDPKPKDYSISYYIRNWMHHPESRSPDNPDPTPSEWEQSIQFMQDVIDNNGQNPYSRKPKNGR